MIPTPRFHHCPPTQTRTIYPQSPRWLAARRALCRTALALLLVCVLAAAVLLPVSQSLRAASPLRSTEVGRASQAPRSWRQAVIESTSPRHQLLHPAHVHCHKPTTSQAADPRPSLRLLAAWRNPSSAAASGGLSALLPEEQRAAVVGERALPGSGVVVLELSSSAALQQAYAALSAAANANATDLLYYVLQDFPLIGDFAVSGDPVTPKGLFDQTWGPENKTAPHWRRRRRRQRRRLQHHAAALVHSATQQQQQRDSRADHQLRHLLATGDSGSISGANATANATSNATASLPQYLLPGTGLDVKAAWADAEASPAVVVAVMGSGVEGSHPRLGAAMWSNAGELPADGIDNDGNGEGCAAAAVSSR